MEISALAFRNLHVASCGSVVCGVVLGSLGVKGWSSICGGEVLRSLRGVVLRSLRGVVLRSLRGVVLRSLRGVVLRSLRGVTRGRVIFWGFGVVVRGIVSCGLHSGG
jgi:hypothetical protein